MKRIIFIIIVIILVLGVFYSNHQELFIPDNSIRLRIIPNSNKEKDIFIKNTVKKYLENTLYQELKDIDSIIDARIIIEKDIPFIKDKIDDIFEKNNYDMGYDINFGYNYFPEKTYMGKVYDEGLYESLVVKIGKGDGDNWWCALFPNFCLLDLDNNTEYKSFVYEIINDLF